MISCGARLAVFDIAELREVTAYDELELDTLGDRKTALFLIMSDTDDSFNFLISMCYTQLFNLLCEKADDVYGGRLPVHVRCLIDECANIGQIPKLEKLVATIRSREISACLVLQAQSQLKAIYKDNADTIIGNMDTSIFLGGKEPTMLGRRKKEFATYELIGMEARTVRNLFLAENSIIGTGAFLLGSLVGTGLSGLLNQVVKNIFEVPHTYQVSFSLQAWAVTFLFFALMYGFGMLRAAKIIRHQKVIDLLYDNRKNEEYRFKSFRHSLLVVLLSIAAMVAGVILLGQMLQTQTNEAFLYLGGACLLILVGVYELHRQIPLLLHRFAKQNLRHRYKEENLFFLGQIGRRIHSAGRTMAVVAILLTISLATMFVGLTMGAGYKANMKAYYSQGASSIFVYYARFVFRSASGRNSCTAMGLCISGRGYTLSIGEAGMAYRA